MGAGIASAQRRFALIHFVCDLRPRRAGRHHRLTMHKGQWAYCGGPHVEPHHWVSTGGVSYLTLMLPARGRAQH